MTAAPTAFSPSILFHRPADGVGIAQREAPAFFVDLNLDQVVDAITAGREEYDLKPIFHAPLRSVEGVNYRHDVLADLDGTPLSGHITSFAQKMRAMREHLAQAGKLRYKYQKESWFLDAADIYCEAVSALTQDLAVANVRSRGFLSLREYLSDYARSRTFTSLLADTRTVKDDLAGVTYCLRIKGTRIQVRRYESEADYSAEVESTFQKFQQGAVKDYRARFPTWPDMNHIEEAVLDRVALLYPDPFTALDRYCETHRDYLDRTIANFDREVQFYLAYLEYVQRFTPAGLRFCYPQISQGSKEVYARDTFDAALANKLVAERSPVVCNDFYLADPERVFVVTGPNQGGKTTFARTFGQLHHLASIGCLVPGTQARLFLFDGLFTHFEKAENLTDLRGKLQDDLIRIHEILTRATPRSILIMNEIFTSTTLRDALFLSKKVLEQITQLDALCVCVTFVDELTSLSDKTVSMVSGVAPEDPTVRTFRIERRSADGRAYAVAIAEKYGLTYERLKGRLAR